MMTCDRDEILRLLREREAAIARSDAEGAVALYAGDVVSYDLPPPLESRGAVAPAIEGLKDWFATWRDGVSVEMKDPAVHVDGDLAVVHGLVRMRGTKTDAGALDQWHRRTIVLERRGDGWTIVHEHASFPMRMDGSGAAATDLRPEDRPWDEDRRWRRFRTGAGTPAGQ